MKKILFSMAMFVAAAFGASAQNPAQACPQGQACDKAKTECAKEKQSCDKQKQCNPFENLDLTAEQKIKIDELKAKCAAEKAEMKLDGDKANAEDKGQKMLEEVKKILTPEQYVKFLENNFLANGKMRKGGHGPKGDVCKGEAKKCDKSAGDCKKVDKKDCKKDGKDCKKECKKDGKECKKDCKKDGKDKK